MTTSNCPGDWDSVIENKNPSHNKKKKNTRGVLEELLDLPRAELDESPITKLTAGLGILEYALDYGPREPEHARGQWWKTNTDFG